MKEKMYPWLAWPMPKEMVNSITEGVEVIRRLLLANLVEATGEVWKVSAEIEMHDFQFVCHHGDFRAKTPSTDFYRLRGETMSYRAFIEESTHQILAYRDRVFEDRKKGSFYAGP